MAATKTIVIVVSGVAVLAIVATTLGILLTDNDEPKPTEEAPTEKIPTEEIPTDPDVGLVIAHIPNIGRLRGFVTNESTAIFYGLPFSQTTAGQYRWQKPRDPLPVEDDSITVDAFKKSKACPQLCEFPSPEYSCPPIEDLSEDCLNVNVFVPSRLTYVESTHRMLHEKANEENLPVMVYIYGGAFMSGGNSIPLYDARYMVEKGDVIVVTLNYRLGAFGFFYQDDGSDTAALSNFGIYDQLKALEWVQRHIKDFGGNPEEVTVFGQSAGAQSIAVLMLMEEAEPLFKRAIMQSNPFGLPYKDIKAAQTLGDRFARWAGCKPNDLKCLRGLSMEKVLQVYGDLPYALQLNKEHVSEIFEPYAPILDNIILDNDPMFLFNEGKNQDKPIMMGYVEDEGAMFIGEIYSNPIQSNRVYQFSANVIFKSYADEVVALYPPQCPNVGAGLTDCDNRCPMNNVVTDYMFLCPGRKAVNSTTNISKTGADIWFYTFNETWSFPQFWENYTMCWDMVCHTGEVPYLFDIDKLTEYRFSDGEAKLAQRMIKYWTNFAKYGDPNGIPDAKHESISSDGEIVSMKFPKAQQDEAEVLYWPRFFEADPKDPSASYRVLQMTAEGDCEKNDFRKSYCDFFDGMDYYLENYSVSGRRKSVIEALVEAQKLTNKNHKQTPST